MKLRSPLALGLASATIVVGAGAVAFSQTNQVASPKIDPTASFHNVLSGALYLDLLNRYGLLKAEDEPTDIDSPAAICVEFHGTGLRVTTTTNHDVEPSVVATAAGGQTYKAVTFMRGSNIPNTIFASKAQVAPVPPAQELPRLAAFQIYIDPWLDANNTGAGQSAGRLYNAGLMTNGCGNSGPSAIGVWRSDSQGTAWFSPVIAAQETTSTPYCLDSPRLVVSTATATQGWVYVAYVRVHVTTLTDRQIYVLRSSDGGQSWSKFQVVSNSFIGAPQIVVDPSNGNLYCVWGDFGSSPNTIKMSKSTNNGATWSSPEIAAAATYDFLGGSDAGDNGRLGNSVPATTRPTAQFNASSGRITVVWHERRSPLPAKNTDVYFTSRTTQSTTWQPKLKLNEIATPARDYFMPGIDFDSSGTALVSWYAQTISDPTYRLGGQKLASNGAKMGSNFFLDSCESDADFYGSMKFMGDYLSVRTLGTSEGKWFTGCAKHTSPASGVQADMWFRYTN